MKQTILFILILASYSVFAQKRPLIESYDEVVSAAKAELDKSMKAPEGELYLLSQEYEITGNFDIDISLHEKGEVATVFVKDREGGTIKSQNILRHFLKDMRFPFKLPKGKDFKFNYQFNFNHL